MAEPKLPDEVVALTNTLRNLMYAADDLIRDGRAAKSEQEHPIFGQPHRSEWPGRTPGDPDLIAPRDHLPYLPRLDVPDIDHDVMIVDYYGMWQRREIGWPRILDHLKDDLERFWAAWSGANEALDALSKSVLDDLDAAAGKAWKVRVRLCLDAIAEWPYWSKPKEAVEDPNFYLEALLRAIDQNGVPDWSGQLQQVRRFDDDLRALRGSDYDSPDTAHSPDFRSVRWFGESYVFTPTQAACIKILWQNWAQGTPVVGESTVLELAGSAAERLRDVFDKGKHPAWGKMIKPVRKGTFQLVDEQNLDVPAKPQ